MQFTDGMAVTVTIAIVVAWIGGLIVAAVYGSKATKLRTALLRETGCKSVEEMTATVPASFPIVVASLVSEASDCPQTPLGLNTR